MMSDARDSVLTVCPFCSCGCGLYLQRADGAINGVMPSEHHPVSFGRLCGRGWAAHEAPLWGRRLDRPMIRRTSRLEPATWEEALSMAARRLHEIGAGGRPIGVVGSGRATNEENFLAARLARGALRTPHVDSCLRAPYQALLAGLDGRRAGGDDVPLDWTNTFGDIARAEVILLVEDDLANTHPRAAFAILQAVRTGARLVTFGLARTQLARLAWIHVPTIPGELPELPAEVRSAYAEASRAAILLAPGEAPAALGRLSAAFAALAAETGHAGRSGSVLLALPVRANARGALEMGVTPALLPGLAALDDAAARRRLGESWHGDVMTAPGLDVDQMIGGVGALVVFAEELPAALVSGTAARAALERLEFLVVLDAFATETSSLAHVVLPIASTLETPGTFTSAEGRVQSLRPATAPVGEARPGWRALLDLAAAIGLPPTFDSLDDVQRAIGRAVPSYATALGAGRGGGSVALAPAQVAALGATPPGTPTTDETTPGAADPSYPLRLVRSGAFEWGDDPLVDLSPTLRRDRASLRKRYPDGLVELSASDAQRLGVRDGWRVKVASPIGAAVLPIAVRHDIEPGLLVVPFGFRDRLEPVLGREVLVAVRVERA